MHRVWPKGLHDRPEIIESLHNLLVAQSSSPISLNSIKDKLVRKYGLEIYTLQEEKIETMCRRFSHRYYPPDHPSPTQQPKVAAKQKHKRTKDALAPVPASEEEPKPLIQFDVVVPFSSSENRPMLLGCLLAIRAAADLAGPLVKVCIGCGNQGGPPSAHARLATTALCIDLCAHPESAPQNNRCATVDRIIAAMLQKRHNTSLPTCTRYYVVVPSHCRVPGHFFQRLSQCLLTDTGERVLLGYCRMALDCPGLSARIVEGLWSCGWWLTQSPSKHKCIVLDARLHQQLSGLPRGLEVCWDLELFERAGAATLLPLTVQVGETFGRRGACLSGLQQSVVTLAFESGAKQSNLILWSHNPHFFVSGLMVLCGACALSSGFLALNVLISLFAFF